MGARRVNLCKSPWQEGYGAVTVSPTARPQVQRYIADRFMTSPTSRQLGNLVGLQLFSDLIQHDEAIWHRRWPNYRPSFRTMCSRRDVLGRVVLRRI
jgi:hypothetical protein